MNLQNKLDSQYLRKNKDKFKKVFFYRICGTGMGAAACLLKEAGFEVEGADNNFYPPMSTYLETTKIPCHKISDVSQDFLKKFDLIVVGNVVPRLSDDARNIEESGVPFVSFPAALGALVLSDVNVIGIAGTHGKTTTTYFMAQVFKNLGEDPGYFIGGVLDGLPSAKLGNGKHFFIESDEYDSAYFEKISKFRLYEINHLVLTSLEFDHADIFNDIEDIKNEFREGMPKMNGTFFLSNEYQAIKELDKELLSKKENKYFYGEDTKIGPNIIEMNEKGSTFEVRGEKFVTNIIGKHNILNLTTVILYALESGYSSEKINDSIKNLKLVKRRQEVRGTYKGHTVIDDFAHHPRAVELTIDGIKKKYPKNEILVIIEPCSATARSNIFQKEFANSLKLADKVILAKPQRPTSVKGANDLDCDWISKQLENSTVAINLDELREQLDKMIQDDDLILVLSNGTCLGLWESNFVKELK